MHKVAACEALGADVVIDKSSTPLWETAERAAPRGYAAIFDANGVATLGASYAHLAQTGQLVTYGFHTNLPSGSAQLNPMAWARMALGLLRMPKFEPLDMVLSSKSVHGAPTADRTYLLHARRAPRRALAHRLLRSIRRLQPLLFRRRDGAGRGVHAADHHVGGERRAQAAHRHDVRDGRRAQGARADRVGALDRQDCVHAAWTGPVNFVCKS
jgi:hypothetical protein